MIFNIKAYPTSSKNELIWVDKNNLRAKITASAVNGKANLALIKLLARHFGVSKSKIKIIHGIKNKNKVIEIAL